MNANGEVGGAANLSADRARLFFSGKSLALLAVAGLLVCGVNAAEEAAGRAGADAEGSKDDPLTRVEQLRSKYLDERKAAVEALAAMGKRAAPAAPAVVRVFGETDNWQAHLAAAEALKRMGTVAAPVAASVGEVMTRAAAAPDRPLYMILADSLKAMGDADNTVLKKNLASASTITSDPALLVDIVKLLAQMGGPQKETAISAIVHALKSDNAPLFAAAAGQIKGLGGDAIRKSVPALEAAALGKNGKTAKCARDTLIMLGKPPPETSSTDGDDLNDLLDL